MAARNKYKDVAELLIRSGADINAKNMVSSTFIIILIVSSFIASI